MLVKSHLCPSFTPQNPTSITSPSQSQFLSLSLYKKQQTSHSLSDISVST